MQQLLGLGRVTPLAFRGLRSICGRIFVDILKVLATSRWYSGTLRSASLLVDAAHMITQYRILSEQIYSI